MNRVALTAALFVFCAAVALLGLLYPPEIFGRINAHPKTDTAFGRKVAFTLEQGFKADHNRLAGIELALNNKGGRDFKVRIKNSDGKVLSATRSSEKLFGFHLFRFDAIENSEGVAYSMEIDVDGAGPVIDFFGSLSVGNGAGATELMADGKPTGGRLVYRPLYRIGYVEKTLLLTERIGMGKPWFFSIPALLVLNIIFFGLLAYFFVASVKILRD